MVVSKAKTSSTEARAAAKPKRESVAAATRPSSRAGRDSDPGAPSDVKRSVKVTKLSSKKLKGPSVKQQQVAQSSNKKKPKKATLPRRQLYEMEPKEAKRKKPKRMRLTPLIIDRTPGELEKSITKQLQRRNRRAAVARSTDAPPQREDETVSVDDPLAAAAGPYMPSKEEVCAMAAARAIRGPSTDCCAVLHDPLDDAGLPRIECLNDYVEKKAEHHLHEEQLLTQAHQYFSQLNREERRRNTMAMQRINEMKKVNRVGGDKDGFRYVIPKSVSTVVRQIMVAEGVEGAQVDPESLQAHFGGDGVKETESKPMRSKRQRNHAFDDFYQFQVAKKWTRNAESFLARGRASKNMFASRQNQRRSIKKM